MLVSVLITSTAAPTTAAELESSTLPKIMPRDVVQRAWVYVGNEFRASWRGCMALDGCWEWITTLVYVASAFPDAWGVGGALSEKEREEMLAFSFKHWKQHSPYLKGYLALTLKRAKIEVPARKTTRTRLAKDAPRRAKAKARSKPAAGAKKA